MFCVREEEEWFCVQDEDYLKYIDQHKKVNKTTNEKLEYIINNGVRYNKDPITGKFKEKV